MSEMPPGGKPPDTSLSLKISLAGDSGVGKTALVKRFVSDTFNDTYTSTLGAKVSSRRFSVPDPLHEGQRLEVAAAIWDIMGNIGLREVLRDAYFYGAKGVLLVADATRPDTVKNLPAWAKAVTSVAGELSTVVLVNKSDLGKPAKVIAASIEALCAEKGWTWMMASAKTGENVPEAFERVARLYLKGLPRTRSPDDSTE